MLVDPVAILGEVCVNTWNAFPTTLDAPGDDPSLLISILLSIDWAHERRATVARAKEDLETNISLSVRPTYVTKDFARILMKFKSRFNI